MFLSRKVEKAEKKTDSGRDVPSRPSGSQTRGPQEYSIYIGGLPR